MAFFESAGGVDATATIVSARSVGMVNFDPVLELNLTVMRDGMPPYPAVARQAISQMDLSRVQPGSSIIVKVNPESPAAVWADLTRIP